MIKLVIVYTLVCSSGISAPVRLEYGEYKNAFDELSRIEDSPCNTDRDKINCCKVDIRTGHRKVSTK